MSERRSRRRNVYQIPFYWSRPNVGYFHDGMILNGSSQGFCLKTLQPVVPGAFIFVRYAGELAADAGLKLTALAEVKWNRKTCEAGDVYYLAGAKYCLL